MTRRRLITWSVAVLAVVAIGVVASRYPAWREARCQRWIPGVWTSTLPPSWEARSTTYFVFGQDGEYLRVLSIPLYGSARPGPPILRGRGSYSAQGCEVRVVVSRGALPRYQRPYPHDHRSIPESFDVSFVDEDTFTVDELLEVPGPFECTVLASSNLIYHRVTDPPAWLEELLASEPVVEEVER